MGPRGQRERRERLAGHALGRQLGRAREKGPGGDSGCGGEVRGSGPRGSWAGCWLRSLPLSFFFFFLKAFFKRILNPFKF